MPRGLIGIGWRLVNRRCTSNIMCLICKEERRFYCAETLRQSIRHVVEEHPEAAFFLKLRN